jgi:alpha-mannosidase
MKRREVLKGLTTVAGGALLPASAWSLFCATGGANTNPPLAVPIRALARRNGVLMQPIQISVCTPNANVTGVTKLNGVTVDNRGISEDVNTFLVFAEPVDRAQNVTVSASLGSETATAVVELPTVQKFTGYILPHSHHDLGYTNLQPQIEERQIHDIELGIELARKTHTRNQSCPERRQGETHN